MTEVGELEKETVDVITFDQKIKPFKKLKNSLPQELVSSPIELENIGKVIFKISADIPQNVKLAMYHNPRVILVEVQPDPQFTTGDRLRWMNRLGLRVYLPNNSTFLGLLEIKQEEGVTKFVYAKWGRIKKMKISRRLIKELPPAQQPAPLLVDGQEVSELEFEFNDSAMGRFS